MVMINNHATNKIIHQKKKEYPCVEISCDVSWSTNHLAHVTIVISENIQHQNRYARRNMDRYTCLCLAKDIIPSQRSGDTYTLFIQRKCPFPLNLSRNGNRASFRKYIHI